MQRRKPHPNSGGNVNVEEETDDGKEKKERSLLSYRNILLYLVIAFQFIIIARQIMEDGNKSNRSSSSSLKNNDNSKTVSIPEKKAVSSISNKTTAPINDDKLVECTVSSRKVEGESLPNGIIEIELRRDLAPKACAGFVHNIEHKYYDGVFFFRVIEGFGAQFGYNPHFLWDGIQEWKREMVTDDKNKARKLSNKRGTVAFAGGSTTQIFINTGDNSRLDKEGNLPFATVTERSMKTIVDRLYTGYKAGMGQIPTIQEGKEAVEEEFPNMSWLKDCRTVKRFSAK